MYLSFPRVWLVSVKITTFFGYRNFPCVTIKPRTTMGCLNGIMESQSGWGWKWCVEIIWSKLLAQEGPHRTSCWRPHPHGFWLSSGRKDSAASSGHLCLHNKSRFVNYCIMMLWINKVEFPRAVYGQHFKNIIS